MFNVEKHCFVMLNVKLQVKLRFKIFYWLLKLLYTASFLNTNKNMACFPLTFVYPSNKRVIYGLKLKSLKPCIKKFVSVSTLYLKSFEKWIFLMFLKSLVKLKGQFFFSDFLKSIVKQYWIPLFLQKLDISLHQDRFSIIQAILNKFLINFLG